MGLIQKQDSIIIRLSAIVDFSSYEFADFARISVERNNLFGTDVSMKIEKTSTNHKNNIYTKNESNFKPNNIDVTNYENSIINKSPKQDSPINFPYQREKKSFENNHDPFTYSYNNDYKSHLPMEQPGLYKREYPGPYPIISEPVPYFYGNPNMSMPYQNPPLNMSTFLKSTALRLFNSLKNPSTCLYVEGVPSDATEREVAHIFRPFPGFIQARLIPKLTKNGRKYYFCFIDFENHWQASIALQTLQDYHFHFKDNRGLKISFASPTNNLDKNRDKDSNRGSH